MLPKRYGWSSVVLSAAVIAASALPLVSPVASYAQEAPAAAPATEAAPDKDLVQLADDFMHFVLINNVELAKANGQKLLDANPDPAKFLQAFEQAANGRDPRNVMERAARREDLKDVGGKLLTKLEEGYRASARSRDRIRTEVQRLASGYRGYQNAKERLQAAGQYAVPVYLEFLQDENAKVLHPLILKVMAEIGRPILPALVAQLDMSEQGDKTALIRVIGQIGYPQPLPTLVKIAQDEKQSAEARAAAKEAIGNITKGKGVGNLTPSDLYLQAAESYYHKKPSFQPSNPDEAMNPVWVYKKEINNVEGILVPTPIWNDIQAQRSAEQSLRLNPNNAGAISMWIAAGFKRDIDLPQGGKDALKEETRTDVATIARAGGALYLNPVLAMALDDHEPALTLKTITELQGTASITTLVPFRGTASAATGAATASDAAPAGPGPVAPIIRALSYSDRAVRFRAAEILATANPREKFPGYYRVVPVLAEALTQTGSPNVLLINPDQNARNAMKEALRGQAAGYTVYDGANLSTALDNARKAAAFDLVIIPNGPDAARIREIGRTDYRLASAPVLVVAPANQQATVKAQFSELKGFAPLPEGATDEAAITEAAKQARGVQGTPIDQTAATAFATTSLKTLKTLALNHGSIYRVEDAQPALVDALRDKRPEIAAAAAEVVATLNNLDAQRALANVALAADNTDNTVRVADFTGLAESAKLNGNGLDAGTVDKLIKVVQNEQDPQVRAAAAKALGALNIPSNQAGSLILQQTK